ncbi:hypothetical protein [Spongiivirga citrea]|uniref:Uncharacterized protein n=1 Tax=Spongiivirga citrea TaxID=1481457 RepID=A0A6M0CFH6_9FLAO|nr:hypothetical protein [Spongiivirga citrea]NER16551.1 hypothetical protein [Spongiivirga citrea]
MKCYIKYIIILAFFGMSGELWSQVTRPSETIRARRGTRPSEVVTATRGSAAIGPRKIMPHRKNKVWIYGGKKRRINNRDFYTKGRWTKPLPSEIKAFWENKDFYFYPLKFDHLKSYNYASSRSKKTIKTGFITKIVHEIPPKTFDIRKISPDSWDWIHKKRQSARGLEGKKGRTNFYFFKNIRRKEFTAFSSAYDHIIVTDTLFAPVSFLNTDGKPRSTKRSYIKVIANCIIYDGPITPGSARAREMTDYVFSAKEILLKTPYKELNSRELKPNPPFVVADTNIKVHKDPFGENEALLTNRLCIEIMGQIATELNGLTDDWERDKLLTEFQNYRYNKVRSDMLWKDKDYKEDFASLCSNFDSQYDLERLETNRKIGDLTILVSGKIKDLHKSPFKYYALPSIATLIPVSNMNNGVNDRFGAIHFDATGGAKLSMKLEVELGYDPKYLEEVNNVLSKKGLVLEKKIPNNLIYINDQSFKLNGENAGKIIPIGNSILRLKVLLQDEQLSLIKLFPKSNNIDFNLNYKIQESQQPKSQQLVLKVPESLLKDIDYENLIDKFNVIESNTITDNVRISSQLSPSLDNEGTLNYIEVSLQFIFDNKTVFRGPFRLSSYSTLASENNISFVKHSENYKIKVSGKAYYENGERDIVEDLVVDSKFITLEENIFKK